MFLSSSGSHDEWTSSLLGFKEPSVPGLATPSEPGTHGEPSSPPRSHCASHVSHSHILPLEKIVFLFKGIVPSKVTSRFCSRPVTFSCPHERVFLLDGQKTLDFKLLLTNHMQSKHLHRLMGPFITTLLLLEMVSAVEVPSLKLNNGCVD